MRKCYLFAGALMLLVCLGIKGVRASDLPGEYQVDHVAGTLEKVVEKVMLYTKLSKVSKAHYMGRLQDKRLGELGYAVESDQSAIETSASRYASYIGNLTNFVIKNNLAGEKEMILERYSKHHEILVGLQANFERDSGWWLAIQHDVNSTDWLADEIERL